MSASTYVAHCDRYSLVMLHGEIDAHSGLALQAELTAIVEASTTPVIVDMCAVDFCDSWGISMIVTAGRRATARGLRLGLVGLTHPVRTVFRITDADLAVPIFADLLDAVHELTAQ